MPWEFLPHMVQSTVFTSDLNQHKDFSELRKLVDFAFHWKWFDTIFIQCFRFTGSQVRLKVKSGTGLLVMFKQMLQVWKCLDQTRPQWRLDTALWAMNKDSLYSSVRNYLLRALQPLASLPAHQSSPSVPRGAAVPEALFFPMMFNLNIQGC